MRHASSPPPKATKLKCARCGLEGPASMVRRVANPKDATHGQCTNAEACNARVRIAERRAARIPR